MRIKFYALCLSAFLCLCIQNLFAQDVYTGVWGTLTERPNTPINEMVNGFIEILPKDYDPSAAQPYPLIIFLEGKGQTGDGSSSDINNLYGPGMFPTLARDNVASFTNSQKFVILTPQSRKQINTGDFQYLSPAEVNDVIDYALQHYHVDVNKVYLLGLSTGGGSAWAYGGQSVGYASRVAAIVPFSGASKLSEKPDRADIIVNANLPVWTFVGQNDAYQEIPQNAQDYIDAIVAHSPHPEALITVFPGGSHQSGWYEPLQNGNTGNTTYPNLLDWLLSKTRSMSQPVAANVDAGEDHMINLANNTTVLSDHNVNFSGGTVTLDGSVANNGGPAISSTEWVRIVGHGSTIVDPSSPVTTVTNLKPGFYTFQLRATDADGITTTDNVNVTVIAPPDHEYIKIEAEDFSDKSGPGIDYTSYDEGPAYTMGWLNTAGNWLEYDPAVPTTGTYAVYYRYKTSGTSMMSLTADGTSTGVKNLTGAGWHSDSVHMVLNPSSTLRLTSSGGSSWNLNYFEFVLLSAESSLPVKFVYFNTQCSNGAVSVRWKTAQEENSSQFTVQRSIDGANWSDIGSVDAAGQSSSERSYVYVDNNSPAKAYYRVLEQDVDGKISMTGTVKSICGATTKASLYPNPNHGNASLNLQLEQGATVSVQVVNASGALIQQKQIQLPAGVSVIPVDVSSQPNGVYTINVKYADHYETLKMLKK